MAICGTCGSESARIRTIINQKNEMRDECPQCAPQSFSKQSDPSTRKIWIGPEYNPNAYEKRYDKDGVYYVAKPEFTAEQEAKVSQQATDELETQAHAEARKRRQRRTEPMTPAEEMAALAKAREIAAWIAESAAEAEKQAKEAELQAWVEKAAKA